MKFLALLIEPDARWRRVAREALNEEDWQIVEARTADEALAIANQRRIWQLVFCPDDTHITQSDETSRSTTLTSLRSTFSNETYIVVMGFGDDANAVLRAFSNGASDYIRRPCNQTEVRKVAYAVKERLRATQKENIRPVLSVHPSETKTHSSELHLIGSSEAIINIYKKVAQALRLHRIPEKNDNLNCNSGNNSRSFFLTGETGTGKELVARLIHRQSEYSAGAFVPVNCSTLPVELAESELFGYEPGAFTGAIKEKKGVWEEANKGTLFLDEITEAPHSILPKLLRVLQDRTIKRLGANQWIPVDVQVIAASNRDLKRELQAGRFREDLYHRLSLYHIHLPPLRERREDIPLLISYFAHRYATSSVNFSQDAINLLMKHSWAGNVRELENVVRAAVTATTNRTIYAYDLLPRLLAANGTGSDGGQESAAQLVPLLPINSQVKELKLKTVKEALRQHRGNVTRAAAALGMTRPTFYKLLKEIESATE